MVILGAFAPVSSDFATRCLLGAKFVNGHINYPLEHLEIFPLLNAFYIHILTNSAKKYIRDLGEHIYFPNFTGGPCSKTTIAWTVCLWQNPTGVVPALGFVCSQIKNSTSQICSCLKMLRSIPG